MPVIVQIFIFNKFQEKVFSFFLLDEKVKVIWIYLNWYARDILVENIFGKKMDIWAQCAM